MPQTESHETDTKALRGYDFLLFDAFFARRKNYFKKSEKSAKKGLKIVRIVGGGCYNRFCSLEMIKNDDDEGR